MHKVEKAMATNAKKSAYFIIIIKLCGARTLHSGWSARIDTGTEYGLDSSSFKWTRLEIFRKFVDSL